MPIPGVDIPDGPLAGITYLDPTTFNWAAFNAANGTNCVYYPSGSDLNGNGTIVPEIICNGAPANSAALLLMNFVSGPDAAAGFPTGVGPYGCVAWEFKGQLNKNNVGFENSVFSDAGKRVGGVDGGCMGARATVQSDSTGGTLSISSNDFGLPELNQAVSYTASLSGVIGTLGYDSTSGSTACSGVACTGTFGQRCSAYPCTFGLKPGGLPNIGPVPARLGNQQSLVNWQVTGATGGEFNPIFSYNRVEGNAAPGDTSCNGFPCQDDGIGPNWAAGYGLFNYNVFNDVSARPIGGGTLGAQGVVSGLTNGYSLIGNVWNGMGMNPFAIHAELAQIGGSAPNGTAGVGEVGEQRWLFNLCIAKSGYQSYVAGVASSTSCVYASSGADLQTVYDLTDIEGNVITGANQYPAANGSIASAGIEFGHKNTYTTTIVHSNYIDIGPSPIAGYQGRYYTMLFCFQSNTGATAPTYTNPIDFGYLSTANYSINSGSVVSGLNVSAGTPGCN